MKHLWSGVYRTASRPRRLARLAAHVTVAGVAVFTSLSPAAADDFDRSVIVARLAPVSPAPRKITLGATGHAKVDDILGVHGVTSLRQAFPVLRDDHSMAALYSVRGMSDVIRIGVPKGANPDELLAALRGLNEIKWAEFDVTVRIDDAALTPNDPYFPTRQYPLRNTGTQPPADPGTAGADMEMEAAWAHTTGDPDVVLAIIDTGIDFDHPDLAGRIWYNVDETIDGEDLDGNGYISDWRGFNFAYNSNDPDDDHSHGSHCAGIAGADADNGVGIAGMDWNCQLMALKSLSSLGSGSAADVAEAIVYAANNGADVISMSLGSYESSSVEAEAVDYATGAGVTIFAAMGNDNSGDTHYPAGFPNVIAVGATDSDDNRAFPLCGSPGSNYGAYIDICAAGDWVWSTVPIEDGSYGYKCGTSMATPHAAGLAALIKSLRPGFTPAEVRALMRASAEDQVGRPTEDTPGFDIYHGHGRINGRIALQALTLDFAPMISVPGAQAVTEGDLLQFSVSAFDSNFTSITLSTAGLMNAVFVDSGNGIGVFTFTPDLSQEGVYNLEFFADDGVLADTGVVAITVLPGCECPHQADFDEDDLVTAVDLAQLIDIVFFGAIDVQDPDCPDSRGDFNCDHLSDAVDLAQLIDHVFFGGAGPCDPCQP